MNYKLLGWANGLDLKKKKKPWLITMVYRGKNKGMFGNYFFPLIFCFQKQFSIFETKKLVWEPKMDRKQKLFSKLNL